MAQCILNWNTSVKLKVKFSLKQATKAQRGSRCIALLFLQPRRYMGVGGQRHAPAALPPGKTRYTLYRRLDGPQGRSGRVRKISPTQIFYPRTVQPVAQSLYRLGYPGPWNTSVIGHKQGRVGFPQRKPRSTSHVTVSSSTCFESRLGH